MAGGTLFRLFPQWAQGYAEPELVELAAAPGSIGPGPSDARMYVAHAVDKREPYDPPVWLPPYRGWDDALLVLFDLGIVERSFTDSAVFQRREIKGVHWAGVEVIAERVAPYTARMLAEVALGRIEETAYLENSGETG